MKKVPEPPQVTKPSLPRPYVYVVFYELTELKDGRFFLRRVQVDVFSRAMVHVAYKRMNHFNLMPGALPQFITELATSKSPAMARVREYINWRE